MYIEWGLKTVFNVRPIKLFAHEGDRTPVRVLRLETRQVKRQGQWHDTFTLYDDATGIVVGHYAHVKDVDAAIDRVSKQEEPT